MKVKLNVLREKNKEKPKNHGRIQNACNRPELIEVSELLEIIASGGTFRPAAISGKNASGFISGQVFALDFDNSKNKVPFPAEQQISIDEAIKRSDVAGFKVFAGYHTFSSNDSLEKFRLLYLIDFPIDDLRKWEHVQSKIANVFVGLADSTNNCNRLFYGTNKGIYYSDYTAILSKKELLADYSPVTERKAKTNENRSPKRSRKGTGTQRNVEAIQNHDVDYLKKKLGYKKLVFDNRDEFYNWLYREADLAELLDVPTNKAFSCVLPSHGSEDSKPSASVFIEKYGTWRYKCFSEDIVLNIKQVVECVGNFNSEYKVLEFIKSIYNVSIKESEWSIEQKANIDEILSCLSRTDAAGFKGICPIAAYNTRNCQNLFIHTLLIARNSVYPERIASDGGVIFYMSVRQLAKAAGKKSVDKVNKYLKMLIYHGLIKIVPDNEVPKAFLKKAITGKADAKRNHVQFYSIPSWVYQHLKYVEGQGRNWKKYGYRVSGVSYELFYRTEDAEVAGRLYPQAAYYTDKNGNKQQKSTKPKADARHELINEIVCSCISEKGYTTEKEVIEIIGNKMGNVLTATQIKRSIADILHVEILEKVRCNKQIKEEYKVSDKGYPVIIIQKPVKV